MLSLVPLCAEVWSYACYCTPKLVFDLCYSWQQIVPPGRRHPKPCSALMSRTCSGNVCKMWVQMCAGWLSHHGQFNPYMVWMQSGPCAREQALSNAAVIQVVWDVFVEMCLVGIWKLRSCLSALMLTSRLAGMRLEPGCSHQSYFCNEEYVQSQAKSSQKKWITSQI